MTTTPPEPPRGNNFLEINHNPHTTTRPPATTQQQITHVVKMHRGVYRHHKHLRDTQQHDIQQDDDHSRKRRQEWIEDLHTGRRYLPTHSSDAPALTSIEHNTQPPTLLPPPPPPRVRKKDQTRILWWWGLGSLCTTETCTPTLHHHTLNKKTTILKRTDDICTTNSTLRPRSWEMNVRGRRGDGWEKFWHTTTAHARQHKIRGFWALLLPRATRFAEKKFR